MARFRANLKPSSTFVKLFLVVVNFLFLILGIAILTLGIYFGTKGNLINLPKIFAALEALRSVRFLLIACGCFIVLLALCGFLGAFKNNRFFIILYIILCTLILIGNITSVVMASMYSGQLKVFIREAIKNRMDRYYGANDIDVMGSDAFTKGIDDIQKMEQCCGWSGLDDLHPFKSTAWFTKQRGGNKQLYPDSCCPEDVLISAKDSCVRAPDVPAARARNDMHEDDCSEKLMAINSRFVLIVKGSVMAAIVLQIFCITCSTFIAVHTAPCKG